MPQLAHPAGRRVPLAAALLLLGALALVAAPAAAQTPSPPATIDACYVPISGTIYRISTTASPAPGAPKACLSPTHVQFTFNKQGPKGDPGAGLSDFSEVTNEGSVAPDAGGRRSMNAVCPAGKIAVGGNYAFFANGGNYGWGIAPVSSGVFSNTFVATDPPNAFFVLTADAPGFPAVPVFFRVTVKCAKAP